VQGTPVQTVEGRYQAQTKRFGIQIQDIETLKLSTLICLVNQHIDRLLTTSSESKTG